MVRFSIYRITSDRELLYQTDVSAETPEEAIKGAIQEWPHLEDFARYIIAVPHTQVEGFNVGAVFSLPRENLPESRCMCGLSLTCPEHS